MKSFLKAFLITLLILALLIGGVVFFLIKPAFDDMPVSYTHLLTV